MSPSPVGRETPLQGSNAFPQEWRDAADDLSMVDLPDAVGDPDPRSAPELLIDTLDGDATLITLGPLTNVAEAPRVDPGLADRVPEMISMAGAIDVGGNTPAGVAEYNVWVDPVAARELIERMNVTLAPPGIEVISLEGRGTTEAEATGPTVVGVCFLQQRSGRPVGAWLSRPVPVST